MRSRVWVRLGVVLGTASVLVTACSAGKDDAASADGQKVTIASLMGAPDYSTIDYNAQQKQVEELVAECMANEGWEYTPVNYPDSGGVVEYTDEDEVARISREGLGITYYLLYPASGEIPVDDPWADWVNPNDAYVESLSDAERTAYYVSLSGNGSVDGPVLYQTGVAPLEGDAATVDKIVVDNGDGGCQREAYDAVSGDDITTSAAYQEAIQGYYAELQQRFEADPHLVSANERWSACMKDAGFDYENQQAYYEGIYAELQKRADDVLGPEFYKDPMEGWTQQQIDDFYATATPEEVNALYDQSRNLTDDQRTQLEAILADEIKVGLAEHTCSKDLNDTSQEVYADVEQQYALEHADELKVLAASLSSGD